MGTKSEPGAFDCYSSAEPDEPMFVLLGRDKHAPTIVWLWATLRELDGEDETKVAEAQRCAMDMMQWARDHERPVVGIGQAALAAVMELIRAVNSAAQQLGQDHTNQMTTIEALRLFMAESKLGPPPDADGAV